jgi:drug/metabolite transporter (DMT)-like permease
MLFAGTAMLSAPAVLLTVSERTPDPDVVSVTRAGAAVFLSVFAPRIATLVMFSTASLGGATGALPNWLVWFTYLIGVVEFVNVSIAMPIVYLVPAWIALVSIVLLVRRPPQGFELEMKPTPAAS